MNLKRAFVWFCLALMLITELLLFAALKQKDAAQTELSETQAQFWHMRQELDNVTNAVGGQVAVENARLRKQVDLYNNRLAKAQALIDQLDAEAEQNAKGLATARYALQLQQEHLQELQTEKQVVAEAGLAIIHRNTCLNNLRAIDAAKLQWALDKDKNVDSTPRPEDLLPYLKDNAFPACPDGGTYSIRTVDELPTCTAPNHVLPQ
jgi:hypothetical protein